MFIELGEVAFYRKHFTRPVSALPSGNQRYIPIKLGLNVSGTFDDMKFRLGKPQYKSADVPSYTHIIDESIINLRQSMEEIFEKGKVDLSQIRVVRRNKEIKSALEIKETEELSDEEKRALESEGIAIPTSEAL